MGAKLFVQPATAEAFEIVIGNTATIGRTRENTVCLNFSPLVSRQHAVIRCHNGWQYQLIDLGSRNGTYVNNQRVVMPVTLEDGAQIRIAENVLTFSEGGAPGCDQNLQQTVADHSDSTAFEPRPVALLVCDIRGFSSISEKFPSGEVAQTLGAWFREASNVIAKQGGIIDKFIGDAVLAYWGVAQNGRADCAAAFSVARELHQMAASRTWPGGHEFRVAVALHFGRVTCSNVGLAAERDATIIGDAVNTVFRLEAVSKEVGQGILLSGDFAEQIGTGTEFRDLGERELKGKRNPVRILGWQGV